MKRFYKDVTVEKIAGGFRFLLDGKPVQTPARRPLLLPTELLTEAIAQEWRDQDEEMRPAAMPLTRLVNTVLDGVQATRADVIAAILRFGENDLLSYRVETPVELAARQLDWNGLLDWAAERHDAKLAITSGIQHVEQSVETLAAFRRAVEARGDFELAALHVLASITGSLVLGLAVLDGRLPAREAFALSRLDETYQAEKWGRDHEAEARAARLAAEMEHAAELVRLSRA
ncbi:MAG TPA: ATP12 family protein [Rhizomicrobium sp.]|jgi:chaperone required for assembly of F1-ATPase|nr:ATP12 family protein [Rhizomicrobium sp.]